MSQCVVLGCGESLPEGKKICGIHEVLIGDLRDAYPQMREAVSLKPMSLGKEEYRLLLQAITIEEPGRPHPGSSWESIYLTLGEALELSGVTHDELIDGVWTSREEYFPDFISLPTVLRIRALYERTT